MRTGLAAAALLLAGAGTCAQTPWPFETEIAAFEASDQVQPPPRGAVLFMGSSSIRLWESLARDFPGLAVINRGFGGSKVAESTRVADRIAIPYRPNRIVFYAGDNDIADGLSPERVLEDFRGFVAKVRAALPGTAISFVSIKPCTARWRHAAAVRRANGLIRDYVRYRPGLDYIDVFTPMLGPDGLPRRELLREDGLHLSAEGYRLWREVIAARLKPGLVLDAGFGAGGVALSTSPLGGEVAVGYGVAAGAAGRILVAGVLSDAAGIFRLAVWRLAADGAEDPSFGRGGFAASPGPDWGWAMAVDADGRILVAGISGSDWRTSPAAVLRRFLPDGRPDAGFGEGGRAAAASPLGGAMADGSAVAVDAAGGILVAGAAADSSSRTHAVAWRFLPDGRPDPRFGTGGAAVLPQPEKTETAGAWALRRGEDGWLAAGTIDWRDLALWKFSDAGEPVPGFGRGGLATGRGIGRGILQDDAGIWVGGFAYVREGESVVEEQALLSRFTARGASDAGRASAGETTLSGGAWPHRESFAIVRSTQGWLFLGGYAGDRGLVRAAVWKLAADGRGTPEVLVLPNAAGGKEDRIYALALDDAGRLLAAGFSRGADGKMRRAVWRLRSEP